MKTHDFTVISVGGSVVVPDEINISFLRAFRALLMREIKKGKKFVLVVGGGKTTRRYQTAISSFPNVTKRDQDKLGITTIHSNVHLLKLVFKGYEKSIQINPDILEWKPGSSSDLGTVLIAQQYKAKRLLNLTNTDGVYDKDPNKYKNAKRFKELDWKAFRGLLPKKWNPGLSAPFDPIAAREAEKLGLEVLILNGSKLKEVERAINNKPFQGTRIS